MANRAYEVTGSTSVLGNAPGSKFEADLDPVQEARLVNGGAIRVVSPGVSPASSKPDEKPKDETVKDGPTAKSTAPPLQLP